MAALWIMHLKRLKMVIVLGLLIELISGVVGRTPPSLVVAAR